jgi:hypothetical protein
MKKNPTMRTRSEELLRSSSQHLKSSSPEPIRPCSPLPMERSTAFIRCALIDHEKRNEKSSRRRARSVASASSWMISRGHFLQIPLTQDVRDKAGKVPLSWSTLVVLRSTTNVVVAKEWDSLYVVRERPSRKQLRIKGCTAATALTPRRRMLLRAPTRPRPLPLNHSSRGRRRTTASSSSVALVPFASDGLDASKLLRLARQLCSLTNAFQFVVVGTCEASVSDRVRRFVADTAMLHKRAAMLRVSRRASAKGSLVVLTMKGTGQECSAARGETAIALLRMIQTSMASSPADQALRPGFEWTRASLVAFVDYDRLLVTARHTVRSFAEKLHASREGGSCMAIVPSQTNTESCNVSEGGARDGLQVKLAPVVDCGGPQDASNSPPVCEAEGAPASGIRPTPLPTGGALAPLPPPPPPPPLSPTSPPPLPALRPSPAPLLAPSLLPSLAPISSAMPTRTDRRSDVASLAPTVLGVTVGYGAAREGEETMLSGDTATAAQCCPHHWLLTKLSQGLLLFLLGLALWRRCRRRASGKAPPHRDVEWLPSIRWRVPEVSWNVKEAPNAPSTKERTKFDEDERSSVEENHVPSPHSTLSI